MQTGACRDGLETGGASDGAARAENRVVRTLLYPKAPSQTAIRSQPRKSKAELPVGGLAVGRCQRRERHPQKTYALLCREHAFQQGGSDKGHFSGVQYRTVDRATAGDLPEISIFHLQRHRPSREPLGFAASPDFRRQRHDLRLGLVEGEDVLVERVLGADRFSLPVRLHRPIIEMR